MPSLSSPRLAWMLSHSPGLHCGLNPVIHLSPSPLAPHLGLALRSCLLEAPLPHICRPCAGSYFTPPALLSLCVSLEQRGDVGSGMSCCLWYSVSLPRAGHTAVLHCETPHGNHHHHPAGVREVPRWRLQVRMLGGAGG